MGKSVISVDNPMWGRGGKYQANRLGVGVSIDQEGGVGRGEGCDAMTPPHPTSHM